MEAMFIGAGLLTVGQVAVATVIGIAVGYGFRGLINKEGKAVEAKVVAAVQAEEKKL